MLGALNAESGECLVGLIPQLSVNTPHPGRRTTFHVLADPKHLLTKCSIQSAPIFDFIGIYHQLYHENQRKPRVYFPLIHFTTVTTLVFQDNQV